MSDRGIGALIPAYTKELLVGADTAYWEALYHDGTTYSEPMGAVYRGIDRASLKSFRMVHAGEILVEAFPPPGATGWDLVYRRRTRLGQAGLGREVVFIFGYVPMGPVFELNVDVAQLVVYDTPAKIAGLDLTPMQGEPDDLLKPA